VVKDASRIFDVVDVDKSGSIDFAEWSVATINRNTLLTETNLRAAFKLFDKDNSGTISSEEVA